MNIQECIGKDSLRHCYDTNHPTNIALCGHEIASRKTTDRDIINRFKCSICDGLHETLEGLC